MFTDESKDETVDRIRKAAIKLVKKRGLDVLSFSTVAARVKVTRTAPMYYFGSRAGLLAAIAEYGFDELTKRLRARNGIESERSVKHLALIYADYALQNHELYRVMHAPEVWQATAGDVRIRRMGAGAAEKTNAWIQKAVDARNLAFEEFVIAAKDAQAGGQYREAPAALIAHLVTAIVDGFLFQHFQEYVTAQWPAQKRLQHVEQLLDLALAGAGVPTSLPNAPNHY